MKITIERGNRRYEVVPCGRRCSFAKPFMDATGHPDVCEGKCNLPKWFTKDAWRIMKDYNYMGLREIGMSQFDKSKERTK